VRNCLTDEGRPLGCAKKKERCKLHAVRGLTVLGTVFGERLTPEHYEVYASVLGNLLYRSGVQIFLG
jgi:hypothetical protein